MSTSLAAENAELRTRIRTLENRLNHVQSDDERNEIAAAHVRADHVAAQFGDRALQALPGETPLQYRRRLLKPYLKHSPRFTAARLDGMDAATLSGVEEIVYADAVAKARAPESYPPGTLHAIQERDTSGRLVTRFVGDPLAWMGSFMLKGAAGRIVRDPPKGL